MVGHQDPGDQVPAEAADGLGEQLPKANAILIRTDDVVFLVAAIPRVPETILNLRA